MLKIFHFVFGHKKIKVDSIEIEGGELSLYACSCGQTSWKKNYRLDFLAEKHNVAQDVVSVFGEESPLVKSLKGKNR